MRLLAVPWALLPQLGDEQPALLKSRILSANERPQTVGQPYRLPSQVVGLDCQNTRQSRQPAKKPCNNGRHVDGTQADDQAVVPTCKMYPCQETDSLYRIQQGSG